MWYKLKRILIYPDGVTEKQVYPVPFKPWANTLAYYPLNSVSTVNDLSGNGRNLTNNWVTFWTYDWIDCAYFSWSSYLKNTYTDMSLTEATINIWVKKTRNADEAFAWLWDNSPDTQLSLVWNTSDRIGSKYYQSSFKYEWYKTVSVVWNWINLVLTVNSSWNKVWYNWVQQSLSYTNWSSSTWLSSFTTNNITLWAHQWWNSNKFIWYISNAILENRVRTADEILNYYNNSKFNYWL